MINYLMKLVQTIFGIIAYWAGCGNEWVFGGRPSEYGNCDQIQHCVRWGAYQFTGILKFIPDFRGIQGTGSMINRKKIPHSPKIQGEILLALFSIVFD